MARAKVVQIRKVAPPLTTWEEALQEYPWFKQAEGVPAYFAQIDH